MPDQEIEKLSIGLEANADNYTASLDDAEKRTDGFIGSLISKFDGLGGLLGGLGLAGAAALGAIGIASFDLSASFQTSQNSLQDQLGLTADEAANLNGVVENLFGQNWGDSVDDVSQSLITVKRNLKDITGDELDDATINAIKLRDTLGIDVADSTSAVNALMTELGLSQEQAFDFITRGMQKGLDTSGDFLDTIGEYSNQFGDAGFSADEFFSILESGQGSGVLGLDKAADAVKEFSIRIKDGSSSTSDALTAMGINTDDFFAKMASGEITTADAMDSILRGLRGIDDPLKQGQLGVALFGTQWEDLGAEAILALDTTKTGMGDLEGATNALGAKYNTLGSVIGGAWRMIQVDILKPIGDTLLDIANVIMPYVSQGISAIGALVSGDIGFAQFFTSINGFLASLAPLATSAVQWILDAIPLATGYLASFAQTLFDWIGTNAPTWLANLAQFGQGLVQWILDALPGVVTNLGNVLTGMVTWVLDSLPTWGANLLALGNQLWQWVIDALPGLGSQLGTVLESLLTWAGDTLAAIVPRLAELGWAFVSWIVTDVLPALPGKLAEILLALGTFLGNVLIEVVPKLQELGTKFYNWITETVLPALPGKLGEMWTAISTWISDTATKAWEAAKQIGANIADGISGAVERGMNGLWTFVAGIINPIIDAINLVIDGINAVGGNVDHIPKLAMGTPSWLGGLAIAGEKGPELAFFRGQAQVLTGGMYDLPAGTEVWNANRTAQALQRGSGDGMTIIQNFPATHDDARIRAIAFQATNEALRATAQSATIKQQTRKA